MHDGVGPHNVQEYRHSREPNLIYKIIHNQTYFWIKLHDQQFAMAKFHLIDGKRPGYDFTHEKAIDVIDGLYSGEIPQEDETQHLGFFIEEKTWRDLRSGKSASEFCNQRVASENNKG